MWEKAMTAIDYMNARGYLTGAERQNLFHLSESLSDNAIIVNIGVEYGASIACLRAGNPMAAIFGIDIDISKANQSIPAKYIEEDSGVLPPTFPADWWLDLLFIDGDHSYAGVQRDLAWVPLVKVGGYLLFHDCYDWPPSPPKMVHQIVPGVNRAVSEWYAGSMDWNELDFVDSTRVFKRER